MRKRTQHSDEEAARAEAAAPAEGAEAAEAPAPDDDEDPLARLSRERDEAVENWRRARADYQNLRRRLQGDIDLAVERNREELLGELLLVLDYLDMALATRCETDEGRNLLLGVQLTRQQLVQFLEQQGVVAVPREGRFDPAIHQAIEMVAAPDAAPGDVVETVRVGYRIRDRVLRYAQVRVAAEPGGAGADEAGAAAAE